MSPYSAPSLFLYDRHDDTMAIDKLKTSCLGVDETWQGIWPSNDAASYNPLPRLEFDFDEHGPYANYNWELFFHVPLTIAVHLSKNQRFAEAQRWFHYIFDPTRPTERRPARSASGSSSPSDRNESQADR